LRIQEIKTFETKSCKIRIPTPYKVVYLSIEVGFSSLKKHRILISSCQFSKVFTANLINLNVLKSFVRAGEGNHEQYNQTTV